MCITVITDITDSLVKDLEIRKKRRPLGPSYYRLYFSYLYFFFSFCRLIEMEGDGFLTDILLNGGDGDVAGLDDLNFPITQDTQSIHDLPSEV